VIRRPPSDTPSDTRATSKPRTVADLLEREPTEAKYEEIDVVDYDLKYAGGEAISLTVFPENTVEGNWSTDLTVTVGNVMTTFYREGRIWFTRRERKHRRPITVWTPPAATPDDRDPEAS